MTVNETVPQTNTAPIHGVTEIMEMLSALNKKIAMLSLIKEPAILSQRDARKYLKISRDTDLTKLRSEGILQYRVKELNNPTYKYSKSELDNLIKIVYSPEYPKNVPPKHRDLFIEVFGNNPHSK